MDNQTITAVIRDFEEPGEFTHIHNIESYEINHINDIFTLRLFDGTVFMVHAINCVIVIKPKEKQQ